jgi:hypothetical protein
MLDLSNHYRSPYLRCLPHWRTYFRGLFCSCNIAVKSMTLTPRRIAFLLIFLMRTLETGLVLILALAGAGKTPSGHHTNGPWVLWLICMVAFTFELWNLHLIVESEGDGAVWGKRVPEGAITLFMFWITVWHVIVVGLEVTGMAFYIDAQGTFITEGIVIVFIALVGWVAKRDVGDGGLSLA